MLFGSEYPYSINDNISYSAFFILSKDLSTG